MVGVVAVDVGWGGRPSSWVEVSRMGPTPEGKKGGAVAISVCVFVPCSGRGSEQSVLVCIGVSGSGGKSIDVPS